MIKIVVIGDIMLDRSLLGEVSRVSPEAPVPILIPRQQKEYLGGAGNVAHNLSAAGAIVTLVGALGNDTEGTQCKAMCRREKITLKPISTNGPTTLKHRFLAGQQLIRVDREQKTAIPATRILKASNAALKKANLLIISDYGKGVCDAISEVMVIARKLKLPILIDPKGTNWKKYQGGTILTPNLLEFQAVYGESNNTDVLEVKMAHARKSLGLKALVVTKGKDGVSAVDANKTYSIRATAREVFDVTGAGDTFISFLGLGIAKGLALSKAIPIANRAAGMAVAKRGVTTLRRSEVQLLFSKKIDEKVHTLASLKEHIRQLRTEGATIGFTNGCFDILHPGHTHCLSAIKQEVDYLIVALNSDTSVRALKGPSRPINSLKNRIQVLSALTVVDIIVSFSEKTPLSLIRTIKPDVLAKGADYDANTMVGASFVKSYGGRVLTTSMVPRISTSVIINKINS